MGYSGQIDLKECSFLVKWSVQDGEWVATCDAFPSLSYLAETRTEALDGMASLAAAELADLAAKR